MAILSRSGGGYSVLILIYLIVCHSPLSRTPSHPHPLSQTTHHTSHRYVFKQSGGCTHETDMAILSRSGGGYSVLCLSYLIVCHSPLSRTPSHPHPLITHHISHTYTDTDTDKYANPPLRKPRSHAGTGDVDGNGGGYRFPSGGSTERYRLFFDCNLLVPS